MRDRAVQLLQLERVRRQRWMVSAGGIIGLVLTQVAGTAVGDPEIGQLMIAAGFVAFPFMAR